MSNPIGAIVKRLAKMLDDRERQGFAGVSVNCADLRALTDAIEGANRAAVAFDMAMAYIGGCSDGYCVIRRPKGQHTNGGCKCYADRMKMQRFVHYANRLRAACAPEETGK